jgi:uncharacterized integral membrane protein
MRLVLVLLVIVMGLFAAFAIQNPVIVTVKFFTLSRDAPILVVIVAAFGAGVVVGVLPGIPASFRRKRRIRELESELAVLRRSQPPPPPVTP